MDGSALRGAGDDDSDDFSYTPPSSTVSVVYEVEGSGAWADVTMRTPTGIEQIEPDLR